ncbi:D-3-phosphoglycerate dehydrogenase, ASB domain [Dillenia turbinata]|uniref:phosphoglycerate dehydrogenase n=1 Tax=Dillenia turbinata TaxID=194707 RepID=A0AAN8ZQK6_9MAGN
MTSEERRSKDLKLEEATLCVKKRPDQGRMEQVGSSSLVRIPFGQCPKQVQKQTEVKGLPNAEAVVGALKGELAATAVNAPMVPAEALAELTPYVLLAEKLGRLAVQLVAARGPDDLDTRLLRAMIAKGLIEPVPSVFVNLVNADFTAKQRGLKITEERVVLDGSPESPLEYDQVQIAGKQNLPVPSRSQGRQVDRPDMIGKVGMILAEENVNVNFMTVGRIAPQKQAVMAIGVDEQPSKEPLKKIGKVPAGKLTLQQQELLLFSSRYPYQAPHPCRSP